MDVAIAAGKIARVAPDIPAAEASQVVDVSGLIVTPGILDIHTHVYPFRPRGKNYVEGVNADAHLFCFGRDHHRGRGHGRLEAFPRFQGEPSSTAPKCASWP